LSLQVQSTYTAHAPPNGLLRNQVKDGPTQCKDNASGQTGTECVTIIIQ